MGAAAAAVAAGARSKASMAAVWKALGYDLTPMKVLNGSNKGRQGE